MTKLPLLLPLLVASTAAAAPPKGAFKLATVQETGKKPIALADVYKQAGVVGEVIFELDDTKLTIGVLVMSKKAGKRPTVTSCRAGAAIPIKWKGETLELAAPVDVIGWADTTVMAEKGGGGTSDNSSTRCNFQVREVEYKVAVTGDKVTLTHPKATMSFVRATGLSKVDVQTRAEEYVK